MRFLTLATGLLPLVAAGGMSGSLQERAEAGLSPKMELKMEEHARRAVEALYERGSEAELGPRVALPAPQAASSPPATTATAPSSSSTSGLPNQVDTATACQSQLALLNGAASNPSGKGACYNIGQLNNATGAFEAQVLIFNIGLPTGQWSSLLANSQEVSAQYPGGKVSNARNLTLPVLSSSSPALNASLLFTGQLNSSMLGQFNNQDAMRAALMPMLTIAAETSDGEPINTTMSNQEAAFVGGFFADSTFTQQQFELSQSSTFVLPGTTFGIFPVGLIVTGSWALLFLSAIAYGTYGRYQFRMSYRRLAGGRAPPKAGPARAAPGPAAYDIKG